MYTEKLSAVAAVDRPENLDMITQQDVAAARLALGEQLAALRNAAGHSQQELATQVFSTRSSVANTERGRQGSPLDFWERCDQFLNANGTLVHGYDQVRALERRYHEAAAATVDRVRRRSALRLPGAALSALLSPAEPWARLSHILRHPERLDDLAMEHLEWRTAEFFRREEQTESHELIVDLQDHVACLDGLLDGAPDRFTLRLLVMMGEALALSGWLAWDCKEIAEAHELYQDAAVAAQQAGDGPLYACVMGFRSYSAEANGDLTEARRLLDEGQQFVRSPQSAATRSWLAARESEVHAALGDQTSALLALDRALTVYDYARPHRERSWTGFLSPSRLGSMAVTTHARLDHPGLEAVTESVVAALPAAEGRKKTLVLADLASAAIKTGQHDRGAHLGHVAVDQVPERETRLIAERLRGLHRLTRDQRHIPVLAELNDRLVASVS